MNTRSIGLALAILASAILASPPIAAAQQPARAAAPAPKLEVARVTQIEGTWLYAKDPTGAVSSEGLYEGSRITFGPGGAYVFQLADTRIALKGTWKVTGVDGNTVRVHTEYGNDRRNDLALTLRRDSSGKVVGMEVREGDGSTGARYYVLSSF